MDFSLNFGSLGLASNHILSPRYGNFRSREIKACSAKSFGDKTGWTVPEIRTFAGTFRQFCPSLGDDATDEDIEAGRARRMMVSET